MLTRMRCTQAKGNKKYDFLVIWCHQSDAVSMVKLRNTLENQRQWTGWEETAVCSFLTPEFSRAMYRSYLLL